MLTFTDVPLYVGGWYKNFLTALIDALSKTPAGLLSTTYGSKTEPSVSTSNSSFTLPSIPSLIALLGYSAAGLDTRKTSISVPSSPT